MHCIARQAPLPWDFPGKNTGVGSHFLLQGIFPTQRSKLLLLLCLLHCRQILLLLSHGERQGIIFQLPRLFPILLPYLLPMFSFCSPPWVSLFIWIFIFPPCCCPWCLWLPDANLSTELLTSWTLCLILAFEIWLHLAFWFWLAAFLWPLVSGSSPSLQLWTAHTNLCLGHWVLSTSPGLLHSCANSLSSDLGLPQHAWSWLHFYTHDQLPYTLPKANNLADLSPLPLPSRYPKQQRTEVYILQQYQHDFMSSWEEDIGCGLLV